MKKITRWSTLHWASHAGGASPAVRCSNRPVAQSTGFLLSAWAGRLTVIVALMAFFAAYIFGIAQYGWLMGMGIGWLPAASLAWLTAQLVAVGLANASFPRSVTRSRLTGLMPGRVPSCCRDKGNKWPQCRRQDRLPVITGFARQTRRRPG